MKLGSGIIIILLLHLFTLEATAQGENQRLPVKEKSFRFFSNREKAILIYITKKMTVHYVSYYFITKELKPLAKS